MKKLLLSAVIAVLFNGCSQNHVEIISPKLHTIDAKTKALPTRSFDYEIVESNTTVTVKKNSVILPLRDARWIKAKLNRCIKNNRKLEVANKALNKQIGVIDGSN